MDMRFGVHRPIEDARIEESVTLGVVRTKANVAMNGAPGISPNCRLCHSTVLFTNPDPNYSFFLEKHSTSYTKPIDAKVPLIPIGEHPNRLNSSAMH